MARHFWPSIADNLENFEVKTECSWPLSYLSLCEFNTRPSWIGYFKRVLFLSVVNLEDVLVMTKVMILKRLLPLVVAEFLFAQPSSQTIDWGAHSGSTLKQLECKVDPHFDPNDQFWGEVGQKSCRAIFWSFSVSLWSCTLCLCPRVTRLVICILLSHNADNYPMLYLTSK